QVVEAAPVVPLPVAVPAILTALPADQEAMTTAIMNGVEAVAPESEPGMIDQALTADPNAPKFSSWVSNGPIDRDAETKQNQFANFLRGPRFRGRALTIPGLLSELK